MKLSFACLVWINFQEVEEMSAIQLFFYFIFFSVLFPYFSFKKEETRFNLI
jgi:hypothetical protein